VYESAILRSSTSKDERFILFRVVETGSVASGPVMRQHILTRAVWWNKATHLKAGFRGERERERERERTIFPSRAQAQAERSPTGFQLLKVPLPLNSQVFNPWGLKDTYLNHSIDTP
jgi:hypothetical protein